MRAPSSLQPPPPLPHKQTEKDWSDAELVRLRVMDQDRSSTGLYTNRPPPPTVLSLWLLEHQQLEETLPACFDADSETIKRCSSKTNGF